VDTVEHCARPTVVIDQRHCHAVQHAERRLPGRLGQHYGKGLVAFHGQVVAKGNQDLFEVSPAAKFNIDEAAK